MLGTDLQLILLPFADTSESDAENLVTSSRLGDSAAVEKLLQRPQDPDICVTATGLVF